MLRALVTTSYDRRRRVLVLWIGALVAAIVLAATAGGDNEIDFTCCRSASPPSPAARSTSSTRPTAE